MLEFRNIFPFSDYYSSLNVQANIFCNAVSITSSNVIIRSRNSCYSYLCVLSLSAVHSEVTPPCILPSNGYECYYKQQIQEETTQLKQRGCTVVVNINAAPTSHHYPSPFYSSIKCKSNSPQFSHQEIYSL